MKQIRTLLCVCKPHFAVGYASLAVASAFAVSAHAQQSAHYLNEGSIAIGRDGTIAASSYNQKTLRLWSYEGGRYGTGQMVDIDGTTVTTSDTLEVNGVADGGNVIVGGIGNKILYWKKGQGYVNISAADGSAYGVSRDGNVIIGTTFGTNPSAFRWESGTLTDLGALTGSTKSEGTGVSADGSVVVGHHGNRYQNEAAFRWENGTMTNLGKANSNAAWTNVGDVSGDGKVMVGWWVDGNTSYGPARYRQVSYRWTQSEGFVDLPALANFEQNFANATNLDGSVIVGSAIDLNGSESTQNRAWRWTSASNTTQSIEDWLIAGGVTPAPGSLARTAEGVSEDGNVVIGYMNSGGQYIARVCPATGCVTSSGGAGGGSGLITVDDFQQTIGAAAAGGSMALGASTTAFNGAHSRPLASRVEPGQNTFWASGDWGVDKHGSRDGDVGLAEIGLGRNFGPAQLNVSLGYVRAKQDFDYDGRTKTKGMYAMAEGLVPISGTLWGVLSLYHQRGDSTINRGYLNAGNPDMSSGSPDVRSWGVRGRLQWDKLWHVSRSHISPYLDVSYTQAKLDAYTETGGGFPARFDSRTDDATELRLGFDMETPLSDRARLITILEGAHRFERRGDTIRGEVVGLFPFALDGQEYDRSWLRGAVGLEGSVLTGTGSLMVNATTKGSAPSAWVAVNWRKSF